MFLSTAGGKSRQRPKLRPLALKRRRPRSLSTVRCATSSSNWSVCVPFVRRRRGVRTCKEDGANLQIKDLKYAVPPQNKAWGDAERNLDSKATDEALAVSAKLASANPEAYTAWNLRRKALLKKMSSISQDAAQALLTNELRMLEDAGRAYPKTYWILNHRRWVLQNIPQPDWQHEMRLVEEVLGKDDRNFHAWDYRRHIVPKLAAVSGTTAQASTKAELVFTSKKIAQSFSNYSAWHYRSKLLERQINAADNGNAMSERLEEEFELVKSAIYTDPDDQSAWLYHWWLVGQDRDSRKNDPASLAERRALLQREISVIRELLELEEDAKWPMQSLVHLLTELRKAGGKDARQECVEILRKLQRIDPYRARRYEDWELQIVKPT